MMKPLVMFQRDSPIPDLTNPNVKSWNLVLNTIFVRKHLTQPYTTTTSVCSFVYANYKQTRITDMEKFKDSKREPLYSKDPELDLEVGLEFITPRSLTLVIDYFTINSDYYAYLILIRRTVRNVLLASVFTLHRFKLLSTQWWDPFVCEIYR